MTRFRSLPAAVAVALLAAPSLTAEDGPRSLRATLRGVDEVPVVSTPARGTFKARLSNDGTALEYELSYRDLQADVTMAHIHLGKPLTNGGIAIWLCGTVPPTAGPAGTPTCVGTRTGGAHGVITAANVVGPMPQGIAPGELEELLKHVKAGHTYVNVHTTNSPGGEIRGLLKAGGGDDD